MSKSVPLNLEGILLLEQPFAKMPHDELRRQLRTQQRLVERELTYCDATVKALGKHPAIKAACAQGGAGGANRNSTSIAAPATTTTTPVRSSRTSVSSTPLVSHSPSPRPAQSRTTAVEPPRSPHGSQGADSEHEVAVSFHPQLETTSQDPDVSAISLPPDHSFSMELDREGEGEASLYQLTAEASATEAADTADPAVIQMEKSLDAMIGRLRGLKRKLEPLAASTTRTLSSAHARVAHLDDLHNMETAASTDFEEWSAIRLNRMIGDWMLRRGCRKSAATLARTKSIEGLIDMDLFTEIAAIEDSLVPDSKPGQKESQATCTSALAWCSENKQSLRKIKSTLEFDLRMQEYIELTRVRTVSSLREAIAYARKHLLPMYVALPESSPTNVTSTKKDDKDGAPAATVAITAGTAAVATLAQDAEEKIAEENVRLQVGRAMGLLACGPGTAAYEDLYNAGRWYTLRDKFRSVALQIHSLPAQPILHIALSAGLSSLKVPACYSNVPPPGQNSMDTSGDHSNLSSTGAGTQPPSHLGRPTMADNLTAFASGSASMSVSAPADQTAEATTESTAVLAGGASPPPSSSQAPPTSLSAQLAALRREHERLHGHQSRQKRLLDARTPDCPICDATGLGVLGREVPWSHHANSTLVCWITGNIMDESDPPMCLPNGMVYSRGALEDMASASKDGTVICPRTNGTFIYSSARKMYIS